MDIKNNTEGSKVEIVLSGRLDTNTSPQLEEELKTALEGKDELTFNLAELEYISSAGLRVLLSAQKTMNKQGSMKLIHVSDVLMEIFDVTGFSDILTIE